MAITRATGKAFRLGFSWIMQLAGYEVVPSEEMPETEESSDKPQPKPTPKPISTTVTTPSGTLTISPKTVTVSPYGNVGIGDSQALIEKTQKAAVQKAEDEKAINADKAKMVAELDKEGILLGQIKHALAEPFAPKYTVADHDKIKLYIQNWVTSTTGPDGKIAGAVIPDPEPEPNTDN
jgi:hypothetical protein